VGLGQIFFLCIVLCGVTFRVCSLFAMFFFFIFVLAVFIFVFFFCFCGFRIVFWDIVLSLLAVFGSRITGWRLGFFF